MPVWAWIGSVVLVALAVFRWGFLPGAAVSAAVAGIALIVSASRPPGSRGLWLAFTSIVLGPAALALLIFAITPTYFRPFSRSVVGVAVLTGMSWIEAAAFGLTQFGVRQVARGRAGVGAVILAPAMLLAGVALFGVLLGPPTIILMAPR